ncbi:MAG: HAD family hydrolase [Defluviitaleaceae bacterium]|nr:HAD family hydrolase [Defluviitaleaceae bacterium]
MAYIGKIKINAIVLDLDGSLLTSKYTISNNISELLINLRRRGVKIILATSRSYRSVINVLPILFMYDAIILDNGAEIYIGNVNIHRDTMCGGNIFDILKKMTHKFSECKFACEIDDEVYTNFDLSTKWKDSQFRHLDEIDLTEFNVKRLLFFSENLHLSSKYKEFLYDEPYSVMISDRGTLVQIISPTVSKYKSLKIVLRTFTINIGNVVVFGDDVQDIEMIKNCGVGVAMGNSIQDAKDVADFISKSNDEDGIYDFLINTIS